MAHKELLFDALLARADEFKDALDDMAQAHSDLEEAKEELEVSLRALKDVIAEWEAENAEKPECAD